MRNIETFRKVTLLLDADQEEETQWNTCLDLSNNGYAVRKLSETGKLKIGETTPLSTGLLQNLLSKAQKDAHGFQDTPLGKQQHGSDAETKAQAYKFAETLNRALCEGGPVYCSEAKPNMDLSFPNFEE